jgi:hypothetical protein
VPLTSTVGVPVMPRCEATSVLWVAHDF